MKHLAILVVFLLMGCQTNNNIAPNDITSPKPVIEKDQELTEDNKDKPEVGGFIISKPMILQPFVPLHQCT